MPKIVFGVSGASGMPLAQAILGCYRDIPGLEIHLIVSRGAELAYMAECGEGAVNLGGIAQFAHAYDNLAAPPASGSWRHDGMIVCPCSMSTLASIASGCGHNLIHRAADVTLKERHPLILVARETPLNLVHIRNMALATEAGAIIMPFMPAFYTGDNSMRAAMRNFAGRMLDLLNITHNLCQRWG